MKTSDLFLFGGPILLGVIGWIAAWLSARSTRAYRKQMREGQGLAE